MKLALKRTLLAGAVAFAAHTQAAPITVEADDFAAGAHITGVTGVTLSAIGSSPGDGRVYSLANTVSSVQITGARGFGNTSPAFPGFEASWFSPTVELRADFTSPVVFVSIVGLADGPTDTELARIEIYDGSNTLLDATDITFDSTERTVSFARGSADIAYLIARNQLSASFDSFLLDHLTFDTGGARVPVPGTVLLLGAGLLGVAVARRRRST
ncbi:MAG: PEP-CTERM sorting domain-containing protein [Burkholderiales bacterium]|nr:PEP-CTERM sorting domain-containing protein [Burkholderiales bacterium]